MSDGYPGNLMLLKVDGNPVAGLLTNSMNVNLDPVDVTNKTSAGWRTLLDTACKKRAVIDAEAIAVNDTVMAFLHDKAFNGGTFTAVLANADGDIMSGSFRVGVFNRMGDFDKAERARITLHSANIVYAGSDPTPPVVVAQVELWGFDTYSIDEGGLVYRPANRSFATFTVT